MKVFATVLAALVAPRIVTAFGQRGAAERQCYFGEFLKYIEPATNELDVDRVIILGTSNELGTQGTPPGWGRQEDVVRGEGVFSDPKIGVEALGESIMKQEYGQLPWKNPPPSQRAEDYQRWREANPEWHEGQETGPGKTKPVLLTKNGLVSIKAVKFPTGYRPYQGQLNYLHFDGVARTTSSEDFQSFFRTMSDYQQRIHNRVSALSDGDPARAQGLQLLEMISQAADRALELRVKDHWSVVIDGIDKAKNDIERGMRHPNNFGQHVKTDTVVGRWGSYEIPNMEKTIDAAVANHLFSTKEDAKQMWQKFVGSEASIDHMNVINTFNDEFGRFHGHDTALDRVC
ncbi:hypothetical protein LEL_01109 [Akanthomyces lecanii RCEF 1005]|uniref:Uncharacterized protein n=1 Tax=Akanthomyces lecanii RCEF 1005 TaxID=1081108 RepID=A0A168KDS0_CORDF|nr:hypothetical protein LEL_01109 [Akanthomyces lecanii RCEF 1005]